MRGILIGALVLLNGWLWCVSVPYGRGPDEFDHWAMVSFLRQHHRLPVFGQEPELPTRVAPDGQPVESYAAYPPLPYLLAAPLTLLPLAPWLSARLLSLLAGAATAVVAWRFAGRLFPDSLFLRGAIPAFVGLLPQFSFVSAYLNADALAALLGALTLDTLLLGLLTGWPTRRLLGLGALLGLGLLARYTTFALWPAAMLALLPWRHVAALWGRRLSRSLRQSAPTAAPSVASTSTGALVATLLQRLALVTVAMLVVTGPWLARNLALYGEPIPEQVVQAALAAASPDYALSYRARGWSFLDAGLYPIWWMETFRSFWAAFDLQRLFLPSPVYYALFAGCAVAAAGLAAFTVRRWRSRLPACHGSSGPPPHSDEVLDPARRPAGETPPDEPPRTLAIGLLALTVGVALGLSLWSSWARDPSPQGRYLFPVLLAVATLLALGWREAAPRAVAPRALAPAAGLLIWIAALLLLNLGSLGAIVIPAYFGRGEVVDAIVTLDAPTSGSVIAGTTEVAGWGVERVRPVWSPPALLAPSQFYRPARPAAPTLDRTKVAAGPLRVVARPDVARRFGDEANLIESGFAGEIDVSSLAPEQHRLTVCEESARTPTSCATVAVAVGR